MGGELSVIDKSQWETLKEISNEAFKSGLLPQTIKTPQMAAIIALKGRELGLPPMQALSGLYVVNGKVAMSSELMMALIRGRCTSAKITVLERTDKCCRIEASRNGSKSEIFEFNEADAKRADLLKPGPWTKYPTNMMYARAVSNMGRQMFPDIIAGASYTPEELGGDVPEQDLPPSEEPANEIRDVTSSFDDEPRLQKIKAVIAKFAKLGATEGEILNLCKCDKVSDLTDTDISGLNTLGSDIVNGRVTLALAFPTEKEF